MFRLINNVPEAYVNRSRDFQLLCNLFDLVNNGVKFDIDTIMTQQDTELCRDTLLPLLQHKLGFFTGTTIDDESLRTILKVFPSLVKKKGTKEGIIEAIQLFFYTQNVNGNTAVYIRNSLGGVSGDYIVQCELTSQVVSNLDILYEILKYIIPTGYFVEYFIYRDSVLPKFEVSSGQTIRIVAISDDSQSEIDNDSNTYEFTENMAIVPVDITTKQGEENK